MGRKSWIKWFVTFIKCVQLGACAFPSCTVESCSASFWGPALWWNMAGCTSNLGRAALALGCWWAMCTQATRLSTTRHIHGRCHQSWKRSPRRCPKKHQTSWHQTSPPGISAAAVCSSMQQYIHTTVWVHAQPEKNSLKNGSFHGMPYSPSDTDFSNLKDQLFWKTPISESPPTAQKPLPDWMGDT